MSGKSLQQRSIRSSTSWIPEILALAGTLFSLAALVIILRAYDGRPIFAWKGVTLNAVVSVLATASKAALMLAVAECISQWKWILFSQQKRRLIDFESIDSASHGPLGSVKIFWNCKRALIVRLGALTTILALALDPFTQQIVQYQQRLSFSQDGRATVARVDRYSQGNEFFIWPGTIAMVDADFSMQSAILYGILHPMDDVLQQLSFKCSTSNCTWQPYESLAVCSTCNNLSEQVETLSESHAGLYAPLEKDNGGAVAAPGTAYILPNGLVIDNIDGWTYGGDIKDIPGGVLMTSFGTGNTTRTNSLQDSDTLIWSMSILKVHPDKANSSTAWPNLELEAVECGLYYCVKMYDSNVINGTMYENEMPLTKYTRSPDSWIPSEFRTPITASQSTSLEFSEEYSVISRSDLMLGDKFNISQNAIDSISAYMSSLFTMGKEYTYEIQPNSDGTLNGTLNGSLNGTLNGYYMADSVTQYQPSSAQALFSSPDLNATFQSLARSMSNAIRAGSDRHSIQIGQSGFMVTHYKIVWAWIGLHCALVLAGCCFLALTMQKSRSIDAPVWKSSSLAALACGPYVAEILGGAETVDILEEKAKGESVQLLSRGDTGGGRYNSL